MHLPPARLVHLALALAALILLPSGQQADGTTVRDAVGGRCLGYLQHLQREAWPQCEGDAACMAQQADAYRWIGTAAEVRRSRQLAQALLACPARWCEAAPVVHAGRVVLYPPTACEAQALGDPRRCLQLYVDCTADR